MRSTLSISLSWSDSRSLMIFVCLFLSLSLSLCHVIYIIPLFYDPWHNRKITRISYSIVGRDGHDDFLRPPVITQVVKRLGQSFLVARLPKRHLCSNPKPSFNPRTGISSWQGQVRFNFGQHTLCVEVFGMKQCFVDVKDALFLW